MRVCILLLLLDAFRHTQLKLTTVIYVSPQSMHDDGVLFSKLHCFFVVVVFLFFIFFCFYVWFMCCSSFIGYMCLNQRHTNTIYSLFSTMIYNGNPFNNTPNKLKPHNILIHTENRNLRLVSHYFFFFFFFCSKAILGFLYCFLFLLFFFTPRVIAMVIH